jgi:hypothetical protein
MKSICTYFLHPVYIPNIARTTLARRGEDLYKVVAVPPRLRGDPKTLDII